MGMSHKDSTLEEAARWYARLAAPDCSLRDRTDFERWRQKSPSHPGAYATVQGTAEAVERLASGDPGLRELADRAYAMGRAGTDDPSPWRRRWVVNVALAASVAVVLIGVRLGSQLIERRSQPTAYDNSATQQRRIVLEDGSIVHLDVGSRISVRMTSKQRRVELLAGRALFEVTHDASRPFAVFAGGACTTDLGTRFQVARRDEAVVVTLAEGSVVVASARAGKSWQERLAPGEQLDVSADAVARVKRTVDPSVATSWSRGRLVFRATPLAEAVAEVNHYTVKKLHLGDPSLATLPVSGNVVAGDGELAASAFAAVLPLHVIDVGGEIILFRGHADDPQ
jgi:transmembrane sensor